MEVEWTGYGDLRILRDLGCCHRPRVKPGFGKKLGWGVTVVMFDSGERDFPYY